MMRATLCLGLPTADGTPPRRLCFCLLKPDVAMTWRHRPCDNHALGNGGTGTRRRLGSWRVKRSSCALLHWAASLKEEWLSLFFKPPYFRTPCYSS